MASVPQTGRASLRHARRAIRHGREHDDERGLELSRRAKALEKPAELRVGERHFVVIRIGDSLFGRAIRRVRVEQVHPGKPGARGWGLGASCWAATENPIAGELRDTIRAALGEPERDRSRVASHSVVVGIEPSAQAETGIEHERTDECPGAIAGVVEVVANVGTEGASAVEPLLWTPCVGGISPVMIDVCAGSVSGA